MTPRSDGIAAREPHRLEGRFLETLEPPHDPFTIARDRTPLLFDAGEKLQYSNPGDRHADLRASRRRCKDSPQADIRSLLARASHAADRRAGCRMVGRLRQDDHRGRPAAGRLVGRRRLHARGPTPRIGRLMLREGDWDGSGC